MPRRPTVRPWKRLQRLAFAWLAALILVLSSGTARADRPVIEQGREADALALFAPYTLGAEVSGGYKLWTVSIGAAAIAVELRGPSGRPSSLSLEHPDFAPAPLTRSRSFAIVASAEADAAAMEARRALIGAIQANDHGGFWRAVRPLPVGPDEAGAASGLEPRFDGLWASLAGLGVLILLTYRLLSLSPRWVRLAVPSTVLVGALLRVTIAPATFLGAWPWSRLWPNARVVYESPWLAHYLHQHGAEIYLTDLIFTVNLVYACAMPLVLFVHASQLLRSTKAGVFASLMVAVSPHHLRFSRCEDAFIPSLVLTSLAFALLHTWLRDRSARWRALALAALPCVLLPAYLLRPLNILFIVVYLIAALALHPEQTTKTRRSVATSVIVVVGAIAAREFVLTNQAPIGDAATSLYLWLPRAILVLVSPSLNVLLQPSATPPALLLLAILGGYGLWRRGERRSAGFLVAWLGLFFVTHAYVTQTTMQPRYHLHLLVPFLLLASVGAVELGKRWRAGLWLACGTLILAPLTSLGWIRDASYDEQREYALVREARDRIADGCTVIEYGGTHSPAHEVRFERIGARVGGTSAQRFRVITAQMGEGDTALDAETLAALAPPASCVYVYEGLQCYGVREREPYARECQALLAAAPLEVVISDRIPARLYDTGTQPFPLPSDDTMRIGLYRVRSAAAHAPAR